MTSVTGESRSGDLVADLADEMISVMFEAEPLFPTMLGLPGYDERLADLSAGAEARLRDRSVELAQRADRLSAAGEAPSADGDGGSLDGDGDAVTLAVIAQQARAQVDRLDSHAVEYGISDKFVAPAAGLLSVLPMVVLPDAVRAEAYLTRLAAIPRYLTDALDRHREGLAAGRLPVAHLVRAAIEHLDRYLADPAGDPMLRPAPPADAPGFSAVAFTAERERILAEVVRPAFAGYRDGLAAELVGYGRPADRPGLCWLPDGEALYAGLSRAHTSTTRTPDELHTTGLDLIAALAEEYAELGARVFGTAEVPEIFARLRTDPALHWRDGDELLAAARAAIVRAEAAAPGWFGRIPSAKCLVEPVPEAEAPGAAPAYYMLPSLDGLRPGVYYANTYQASQRGRHTSEVSAFHEAVPGHHFQQSLALELTDLPLLRRCADVNAYAEGWGLYCERLADEMGLYSDDVARFGMLTLDSMRAGRLVVDTGLHHQGWSRQQAIDYLTEHTPMAPVEIVSEVDRYIAAPGQALSYMVGRLELQRLRGEAARALGDRFDIRAFHDLVLGGGPLPMSVLDSVVTGWVRAQARR